MFIQIKTFKNYAKRSVHSPHFAEVSTFFYGNNQFSGKSRFFQHFCSNLTENLFLGVYNNNKF